jgi:hypothetical protein
MMKLFACSILLLLAACAPAPAALLSSDAAATSQPGPAIAPVSATPSPVTSDPASVSRACKVDADCAVKDVGSCCGRHPACVNKDAPTFPNEVKAQCAKEHRAGACNVQAIGGCSCVQGQCRDINALQMPGMH